MTVGAALVGLLRSTAPVTNRYNERFEQSYSDRSPKKGEDLSEAQERLQNEKTERAFLVNQSRLLQASSSRGRK